MTNKITQKQEEILKYLYQYRFLNRIQIQKFLKHKYHKRIIDWLNDLTKKEYINRIYSNKFGENTNPAIYYIGSNGINFLKDQEYANPSVIRKISRDIDHLTDLINRCIFIADIVLQLQNNDIQSKEENNGISFEAETAIDLLDPDSRFGFLTKLKPDLFITKHKKTEKRTSTEFFIFVVLEISLFRDPIRNKIKNFINFYNDEEWQKNIEKSFPNIMIICPNLSTLIYAKHYLKRLIEEDNIEVPPIQYTTIKAIKENGVTGNIWEKVT